MITYKETRNYQYEYHSKYFPYINDFYRNPYTFLKARFYMECSAVLVYFLLKTEISPNIITMLYILSGFAAGIFLAIPTKFTIYLALIIFFSKGILDWSDGHYARVTNRTSITGHVLDVFGAEVNDLCLQIGLGFYIAYKADILLLYYIIPIIPLFSALNLQNYASNIISEPKFLKSNLKTKQTYNKTANVKNVKITGKKSLLKRVFIFFVNDFLDARARTVDLICLIVIVELNSGIFISWIIFILYIIKETVIFMYSVYSVTIKKYAESKINNIQAIFNNFNNE